MKKFTILVVMFLLFSITLFAQVGINNDGSTPDPSAGLDVKFNNKGLLLPRMTFMEMNAIINPASGLMVYCTDCGSNGSGTLAMFINGMWFIFNTNCLTPGSPITGIHIPSTDHIVWNWNPVAWATGYKWNITNDYGMATDMVTATTKTETGLTCNTPYTRYVWAYNTCGNSTPVTLSQTTSACLFTCGSSITDSRDNKVYTTVLIGSQCWMKQNLNIGARINGSLEQTNNSVIEKYCYNDLESNCNIYGGFYQWNEMMQYVTTPGVKGICPTGWHIPTDAEWTTVSTFLGGESVAGGKMKSTGTIEAGTGLWYSPNTDATNESGFTAVPAGFRDVSGAFFNIGGNGYWWISSEGDSGGAWSRIMYYSSSFVPRSSSYKSEGFSVRCVLDF